MCYVPSVPVSVVEYIWKQPLKDPGSFRSNVLFLVLWFLPITERVPVCYLTTVSTPTSVQRVGRGVGCVFVRKIVKLWKEKRKFDGTYLKASWGLQTERLESVQINRRSSQQVSVVIMDVKPLLTTETRFKVDNRLSRFRGRNTTFRPLLSRNQVSRSTREESLH